MKRTLFPALFVLLFSISVNAQKDVAFATARYTLTHISDTTQPENPLVYKNVLYLGKSLSGYGSDRSANSNIGSLRAPVAVANVQAGSIPPDMSAFSALGNYYKDMNTSKMINIVLGGSQVFALEDKTPLIEWNITQEAKEIMGLQCQKAVGDFKGRTYEAWFSSQLPYSNGPWKLGGLPGLIIEASDTKKEVIFKLTSFENADGAQPAIEVPASAVKTTPKEYQDYQDALKRDRDAGIGNSRISVGGSLVVTGTSARAVGGDSTRAVRSMKPRQFNNPIEKEVKK
ncbi:MAG: GLPGLI family protein [Bacteroidota bacterium]